MKLKNMKVSQLISICEESNCPTCKLLQICKCKHVFELKLKKDTEIDVKVNTSSMIRLSDIKLADYDLDARMKLTKDDIKELQELYQKNVYSLKELAEMFHVSTTTVKYHCDEEYHTRMRLYQKRYFRTTVDPKRQKEIEKRTYLKKVALLNKVRSNEV